MDQSIGHNSSETNTHTVSPPLRCQRPPHTVPRRCQNCSRVAHGGRSLVSGSRFLLTGPHWLVPGPRLHRVRDAEESLSSSGLGVLISAFLVVFSAVLLGFGAPSTLAVRLKFESGSFTRSSQGAPFPSSRVAAKTRLGASHLASKLIWTSDALKSISLPP